MTTLSGRDLRAIFRFLEVANDAVAADVATPRGALPRPVLQALDAVIPAKFVESFQLTKTYQENPYTTNYDDEDATSWVDEVAPLRGENPIGAFRWTPAHGPLRLSAVMSPRRLRSLPWHRYYLQPLGIRDQLKVWLWRESDHAACVSLDRDDADFTDRDVAVLAVLQQHLAAMRESLMMNIGREDSGSTEQLTVREAQVVTWAARGRSNREIAEILFISPATVRKHLEHAYAKLGVGSRSQAAVVFRDRAQRRDGP